jgi:hypothetical protein
MEPDVLEGHPPPPGETIPHHVKDGNEAGKLIKS